MVDMSLLVFYVALKVSQDWEKKTIKLFQLKYIEKLLDCHGMSETKTTKVFMQNTIFYSSNTFTSNLKKIKYTVKVDLIIYAIVETKIKIVFAIFMISQFAKKLYSKYYNAINQILQYVITSLKKSTIFGKKKE